jgi:predicted Rossmann fold flavoprotein
VQLHQHPCFPGALFVAKPAILCLCVITLYSAGFTSLVEQHRIAYHEKSQGQLFCDGSSQQIIGMLLEECRRAKAEIRLQTTVEHVSKPDTQFHVKTNSGEFLCESLVVACGGLSIPKMGASGLGYWIARQFGLNIAPTQPALVPFTLTETQMQSWHGLSGVGLEAEVQCGKQRFRGGILFTHRGLSGPAMLQISSYWQPAQPLRVNLSRSSKVLGQAPMEHVGY